MVEIIVEIVNKRGLHARAAAKFVKAVNGCNASVRVMKIGQNGEENSPEVGGSSILGLMMLGADAGSKLHISGDGEQEREIVGILRELVENKFGEEE